MTKIIFYLCGKSGTGKDTVLNKVLEANPMLKPIILYTTREMRDGEVNGETYHFVTDTEFEKIKSEGKLITTRSYHVFTTNTGVKTTHYGYPVPMDAEFSIMTGPFSVMNEMHDRVLLDETYDGIYVEPIYLANEDIFKALERTLIRNHNVGGGIGGIMEAIRRFKSDEEDFPTLDEAKNIFGDSLIFNDERIEETVKKVLDLIEDIIKRYN